MLCIDGTNTINNWRYTAGWLPSKTKSQTRLVYQNIATFFASTSLNAQLSRKIPKYNWRILVTFTNYVSVTCVSQYALRGEMYWSYSNSFLDRLTDENKNWILFCKSQYRTHRRTKRYRTHRSTERYRTHRSTERYRTHRSTKRYLKHRSTETYRTHDSTKRYLSKISQHWNISNTWQH